MDTSYDGEPVVVGTCQSMCPLAELRLRERERLLHPLEISSVTDGNTSRARADPKRVVKAFSRPAAGRSLPTPGDLRPAPVLLRTVTYLMQRIVPISDRDWADVYDFIVDRLRAVRQDAVLQDIQGRDLIAILQPIVAFHVYAEYRLSEAPVAVFDPVLNSQHLLECLKQLLRLYQATPGGHPDRPLFEAVYVLHALGSADSLRHALCLPSHLRESTLVRAAVALSLAHLQGNFVRFLRLLSRLPSVLSLCAAHRHLGPVRLRAVQVMSVAYNSRGSAFPLEQLQQLLWMERDRLSHLLHTCGLLSDDVVPSTHTVTFIKAKFTHPSKVPVHRQPDLDDRLTETDIPSLLLGRGRADPESCPSQLTLIADPDS